MSGTVVAVHRRATHCISKEPQSSIELLEGQGVAGDVHCGPTVRHRSRRKGGADPPNLRQVHLIHAELHAELAGKGFQVEPGEMGENVTTRGVDLLALPRGTHLFLGAESVIEITGLRNPCRQLDGFQPGLMAANLDRGADGALVRKTGVMAVVLEGGVVTPGDPIRIVLPEGPHLPLEPV